MGLVRESIRIIRELKGRLLIVLSALFVMANAQADEWAEGNAAFTSGDYAAALGLFEDGQAVASKTRADAFHYLRLGEGWYRRLPSWTFAAGYGAVAAVTMLFIQPEAEPFVYFQF